MEKKQAEGVQYVVFLINKQLYAFYVEEVVEILRVPTITSIPGINSVIEGVINLRGTIIPVLNLHKRFQLPIPEKHKKIELSLFKEKMKTLDLWLRKSEW